MLPIPATAIKGGWGWESVRRAVRSAVRSAGVSSATVIKGGAGVGVGNQASWFASMMAASPLQWRWGWGWEITRSGELAWCYDGRY